MTSPSDTQLFNAKHALILCALALLLAFGINSIFHSESLLTIALKGEPVFVQIWAGALIGSSLAFLGLGALIAGQRYCNWLGALREQMFTLFSRVDLSGLNPLLIGAMAGLWEETLFRASLQPIVGIWWGSLIFMLCHTGTGQFWTMNWKKAVYAVGVFAAGVLLGSIFKHVGLVAAILTHALIDIVGLFAMRRLLSSAVPQTA